MREKHFPFEKWGSSHRWPDLETVKRVIRRYAKRDDYALQLSSEPEKDIALLATLVIERMKVLADGLSDRQEAAIGEALSHVLMTRTEVKHLFCPKS